MNISPMPFVTAGALAGTGVGLPAAIAAANAGLGGANYLGTQLVNHQKVELPKLGWSVGIGAFSGLIGGRGILYGKTGETVNAWLASAARAKYLNEGAGKIVANGDEIANEIIKPLLGKLAIPSIFRAVSGSSASVLLNGIINSYLDNGKKITLVQK